MYGKNRCRVLMVGDFSPLVIFAVFGGLIHTNSFSFRDVLINIGLLGIGWIGVAIILRPYSNRASMYFGIAWVLGVTVGVFLRALALGSEVDGEYLRFWGITILFTLMLLIVWRVIVRALTLRFG